MTLKSSAIREVPAANAEPEAANAGTSEFARMEDRSRRIVEVAMELAEKGGFDNVRLRDVARLADVALGTLYKRFRSKESILAAALDLSFEEMEDRLSNHPVPGATPAERVATFYAMVTRLFCKKKHLARAVIRAVASGTPASGVVLRFQDRAASMVMLALRGPGAERFSEESLRTVATILQNVWFALLVGWMGGIHKELAIAREMTITSELILGGLEKMS